MHHTSCTVLAAEIESFTFHEDEAPALHGLELSLSPGTLTAVLGPSGSGKSTLGRLLSGWLPPGGGGHLEGFLELGGTRLMFDGGNGDPRIDPAQWGRQVGFVPQDASAVLSTVRATVAEELAFGLENAGVPRAAMEAAVKRTAGLLGLTALLDRHPARLSGGQLRRLAIGCAVITEPPVLIMDEPFGSLDPDGARELALLVRALVKGGTAVVILSQAIDDLLLEAGTWLLLDRGRGAARGTPAELQSRHASRLERGPVLAGIRYVGGAAEPAAAGTAPPAPQADPRSVPALEFRGVSFGYEKSGQAKRRVQRTAGDVRQVLQGIDLAVHPREILAVTGPNGAGKSTLLRHANGLLRPSAGAVLVNGTDIAGAPVGRTAGSVGLLFQHPRDQLFERTALREVRFGLDRLFPAREATSRAEAALVSVGLGNDADAHPAELPASRQRLLALATVLARRPSVIALDEPTVALDAEGLAVLDRALRGAAAEGAAVVLVTHELRYAHAAAHRVVTLDGGRLQEAPG